MTHIHLICVSNAEFSDNDIINDNGNGIINYNGNNAYYYNNDNGNDDNDYNNSDSNDKEKYNKIILKTMMIYY